MLAMHSWLSTQILRSFFDPLGCYDGRSKWYFESCQIHIKYSSLIFKCSSSSSRSKYSHVRAFLSAKYKSDPQIDLVTNKRKNNTKNRRYSLVGWNHFRIFISLRLLLLANALHTITTKHRNSSQFAPQEPAFMHLYAAFLNLILFWSPQFVSEEVLPINFQYQIANWIESSP